jgi:hypothetical protein
MLRLHQYTGADRSVHSIGRDSAVHTMQTSLQHTRAFSATSTASKPVRVQQVAPSRHAPLVQRQSQRVRAIELVSCEAQQQLELCTLLGPCSSPSIAHAV